MRKYGQIDSSRLMDDAYSREKHGYKLTSDDQLIKPAIKRKGSWAVIGRGLRVM